MKNCDCSWCFIVFVGLPQGNPMVTVSILLSSSSSDPQIHRPNKIMPIATVAVAAENQTWLSGECMKLIPVLIFRRFPQLCLSLCLSLCIYIYIYTHAHHRFVRIYIYIYVYHKLVYLPVYQHAMEIHGFFRVSWSTNGEFNHSYVHVYRRVSIP